MFFLSKILCKTIKEKNFTRFQGPDSKPNQGECQKTKRQQQEQNAAVNQNPWRAQEINDKFQRTDISLDAPSRKEN